MADSEEASAVPETPPPPDTVGQRLRNARLMQDLTVEQLSTELRIEAKHLHAIEDDRFEEIGVPVFVKGYLKQYALRLGLDGGDLLAAYHKQTTLSEIEIQPSRTIKLRDERQITSWILAAVVLLAVVGALGVWWWNGGNFDSIPSFRGTESVAPAPAPAPVEPEPESALPEVEARALALPPAEPAEAPAEAPAGEPDADPNPVAAEPALAGAAPAADRPERAAAPVMIPLTFSFDAESWAEVTDARGERLLFGLNAAGRSVTVRGEPPFTVVLGNAGAVQLTVDGAPYAIPRAGRQGELARFAVDIAEE